MPISTRARPSGHAEHDVLQVGVQRAEVDVGGLGDGEVAHHEDRCARIGTRPNIVATCRVARSAASSSTSVSRGRCSGSPGSGTGNRASSTVASSWPGPPLAVAVAGAVLQVGHRAFTPFAAIQMANSIRPPSPTTQAHRPSATGPSPPRASPPRLGCSCSSFR